MPFQPAWLHTEYQLRFSILPSSDQVVYVSSGALATGVVREAVAFCLANGITHVELGSGMAWAADLLEPVRAARERGMRYLVHNYFPPPPEPFVLNLAAGDPMVLERSREHCRRAIQLSAELGAPFFSVHAGFAVSARPDELGQDLRRAPRRSVTAAYRTFVESVQELCAYARARGVRLLVENNVVAPFNLVGGRNRLLLGATSDDLRRMLDDVGDPALGLLVDAGHLKVTSGSMELDKHRFLDAVAPWIEAFHLSDNDGMADQNLAFDDGAWFIPRLADFPDATMILEAYRLPIAEIRRCCAVVERAWRSERATRQ